MEEISIHRADRALGRYASASSSLIRNVAVDLEVEVVVSLVIGAKLLAEARIPIRTVRRSQLRCGAFGHTDLLSMPVELMPEPIISGSV